jgi:hypothetical protein
MIDAYILTLDLEYVCLSGSCGFRVRVYNTGVTHVKKRE